MCLQASETGKLHCLREPSSLSPNAEPQSAGAGRNLPDPSGAGLLISAAAVPHL